MTNQTATKTEITVVTNPESLFGYSPEDEQTYDLNASADRFDELLAEAIQRWYPAVAVEVKHSSVYDTEIHVRYSPEIRTPNEGDPDYEAKWQMMDDQADESEAIDAAIRELIADVHSGQYGDWAVER